MPSTLTWQKSSFSGGDDGNDCLEIATCPDGTVVVRESDDPEVVLAATPARLAGMLTAIRNGCTRTR